MPTKHKHLWETQVTCDMVGHFVTGYFEEEVMLRATQRLSGPRVDKKIPGLIRQVQECHRGELSQQTVCSADG
jgi:hypothetical protein